MQLRSFICAAGLVVILGAAPLSAKVVKQSSEGFVTRESATVAASPQAVWLALINPGEWWSDSHTWSGDAENMTLEPQANGCFCESIPPTEADGAIGLAGSVRHMTVVQSFPRRVLRMRGGLGPLQSEPADGVLTIAIKATEDGTGSDISWNYVVGGYMQFETATIAQAVDGVMSQQLTGLAQKLGGATGGRSDAEAEDRVLDSPDEASADEPDAGEPADAESADDESAN